MFHTLLDETGGTRSSHFLLPPFSLFGTNARFLEMQLWSTPLLSSAMHTTYAQNTERNGLTPYLRIPHSTMCPQCVRHENLWEWIALTKYFLKWTCVWIVASAMLESFNENCSRLGTWIIVMMWKNKYKIAELRVGYCKGRRIFWSNRQKIIGLGQFCVSIRFAFVPGYHTALRGHGTNDKRSQPSPLDVNYRICWHPTVPTMFFSMDDMVYMQDVASNIIFPCAWHANSANIVPRDFFGFGRSHDQANIRIMFLLLYVYLPMEKNVFIEPCKTSTIVDALPFMFSQFIFASPHSAPKAVCKAMLWLR